ncbi:Hypothetical protein, putative [Bodo saltans]|uniref:Uncharacterized protein n=1 Tax=Bodo saltans TaxID=75058 RepID=A0A0S4J4K2_BODSA|nr:Hypothetical protein, putative [Bodo saltans]|eukprot:CUG18965.1 Hypothetical protein, putative [Bodo saltans]
MESEIDTPLVVSPFSENIWNAEREEVFRCVQQPTQPPAVRATMVRQDLFLIPPRPTVATPDNCSANLFPTSVVAYSEPPPHVHASHFILAVSTDNNLLDGENDINNTTSPAAH